MPSERDFAFVTVLEPNGVLEVQVPAMIESVRKWGGRLANAPFFVVSPRLCGPLKASTKARLKQLGATYIYKNYNHRLNWYAYINKPLAMLAVREVTQAKYLVWLDADILAIDEPNEFLENDDVDLVVCPATQDLATTGPSNRFHVYWEKLCEAVGVSIEDLPWVNTKKEGTRVRYYINSGTYRVKTQSKILDHHLLNTEKILDRGLSSSTDNVFVTEQIGLAFAPFTSNSSWADLSHSHNFTVSGAGEGERMRELGTARLVHYHAALSSPANREWFLDYFRKYRPDRLEYLESIAAFDPNEASMVQRLARRGLRALRDRRKRAFLANCNLIDTSPRPEHAAQMQEGAHAAPAP